MSKPKPRELYRLDLRPQPEGYCVGEIDGSPALVVLCPRCGKPGVRMRIETRHVWLHEIVLTERMRAAGVPAWGSVMLRARKACTATRSTTVARVLAWGEGT